MTRDSIWTCRDGTKVKIKDMTDSHIENALAMMMSDRGRGWRSEYLYILSTEQELRRKIRNSPLWKALS